MPSKSGNRARGGQPAEGLAATLGSVAPRRGIDLATVLPTSELRPLRRGDDVQRFNELAPRQEELTEAEADELYRYRIRRLHARAQQLRRAVDASDEQAIRRGLAEFDRRLAELRRLEAVREQAGLATVSDLDLTAREDAVGALVSLAYLRRRGLVAGSQEPPPQPAGGVRLPEVAFAPRPDDAPVYVLAPTSIPSDSLAGRVEAVAGEGAQIRLVHDPAEIPREGPPPLVLNWGSTQALPNDLVALNQPESVRVASDQVESLVRLGELAPRTVLNPQDIPLLGGERMVAKQRHGARGRGLRADAVLRYTTTQPRVRVRAAFIEVDRGSIEAQELADQLGRYGGLFEATSCWRPQYSEFPHVLVVFASNARAIRELMEDRMVAVAALLRGNSELMAHAKARDVRIYFTLLEHLQERGPFGRIWARLDAPERLVGWLDDERQGLHVVSPSGPDGA